LRSALLCGQGGRRGRAGWAAAAGLAGGDAAPPGHPPALRTAGPARVGAGEVAPGLAEATGARVQAGEVRPATALGPAERRILHPSGRVTPCQGIPIVNV